MKSEEFGGKFNSYSVQREKKSIIKMYFTKYSFLMCMGGSHQWCNDPGNFGSFNIIFPPPGNPFRADGITVLPPGANICNLSFHFYICWKLWSLRGSMILSFCYNTTNQWHLSCVKPLFVCQFEFWSMDTNNPCL